MKLKLILLAAVLGALTTCQARVYDWSWHMPAEQYRNLEFTLRAGVDRATKITDEAENARRNGVPVTDQVPRYRAAGAEWKKVQIQAEAEGFEESILAYVIFMQGYCAGRAHDNNESIKFFGEVLDLYPEEKWIARSAKYWMGTVKVWMGDVKAGDAVIDELLNEAGDSTDTIIACALNDRAHRLWGLGREKLAIEYWLKVMRTFKETNWHVWNNANDTLGYTAGVTLDFASMNEAIMMRNDERDEKKALDNKITLVNRHLDWYVNGMRYESWYPKKYFYDKYSKKASDRTKKINEYVIGMSKWAASLKPMFIEAGRPIEADVLAFRAKIMDMKAADAAKESEKIRGELAKLTDARLQGALGSSAARTLAYVRAYDAARAMADVIKNQVTAGWTRYGIEELVGNWKAAALALEEVTIHEKDPGGLMRARYELGWVYRDRLHDYEMAIKVYSQIDNPPRQLWEIAYAYRGAKKNKEAKARLNELVAMYPHDAPEAVYRLAEWAEQDGEKKTAIALYRRLLSQPEWKRSAASSRAHQALERLGVATGGAMTNTVH